MSRREQSQRAYFDRLFDETYMLIDVCRLIARRVTDTDIAEELVDLADALDRGLERLRESVSRSIF